VGIGGTSRKQGAGVIGRVAVLVGRFEKKNAFFSSARAGKQLMSPGAKQAEVFVKCSFQNRSSRAEGAPDTIIPRGCLAEGVERDVAHNRGACEGSDSKSRMDLEVKHWNRGRD